MAKEKLNDVNLKKVSIPDKEWKDYKKSASQEELLVLTVGMKIWLAQNRKKHFIFSLVLLACLAVGIVLILLGNVQNTTLMAIGFIIMLLGYVVCEIILYNWNRVNSSARECQWSLNKENKEYLKKEFKPSVGASMIDLFMGIVIWIASEPILLVFALAAGFFPSVFNTLILVPEGCGFEKLEEAKQYYTEKGFFFGVVESIMDYDASTAPQNKSYKVYDGGYERTLTYDSRDINGVDTYKDDTGTYWKTDDNGNTFYKV